MKKTTRAAMSNFIREFIVSKYGIPYKIVSDNGDNGNPFFNKQVATTLDGCGIRHRWSTLYYPQGNGQEKATNKSKNKMVHEYVKGLNHHWPDTSWVYCTLLGL